MLTIGPAIYAGAAARGAAAGTGAPRPGPSAEAGREPPAGETETAANLASAEEAAGQAKTARRDALTRDLQRLLEIARKLKGVGDLRRGADAMQDLARQIAKVARALAEAERSLPPDKRQGVPSVAVPSAAPAGPAQEESDGEAEAAPDATAEGGASEKAAPDAAAETEAAPVDRGPRATEAAAGRDPAEAPAGDDPATDGPDAEATPGDTDREPARNGSSHEGTARLLKEAAGLLERMRDAVLDALRLELVIDPEAAKERAKGAREIQGFANELRNLGGTLSDPAAGLDLTA